MRNKRVIRGVARALEKSTLAKQSKIGFNLGTYYGDAWSMEPDNTGHECGTVACIAGWTVALYRLNGSKRARPMRRGDMVRRYERDGATGNIRDDAAKIMGIGGADSIRLFEPQLILGKGVISPKEAAKVLRNFADTGLIDWHGK